MAQGEANKVWLIPSDFGAALEGFTRMLGAPGSDGVFRYQPSPVETDLPKPEDDSDEVADWFNTRTDPDIAEAVAKAEAAARIPSPQPGAIAAPDATSSPQPEITAGPQTDPVQR